MCKAVGRPFMHTFIATTTVKDYGVVGAGHAREILATIAGVSPHHSRAWPAPTNLFLLVVIHRHEQPAKLFQLRDLRL
jgi:hypothetical protein